MDLPDPKQLKKLADYCRKAGIKVYECADCKITLDDGYAPIPSAYQRRKAKADGKSVTPAAPKSFIQGTNIPVETLSAQELLFLSCGGPPDGFEPEDVPS